MEEVESVSGLKEKLYKVRRGQGTGLVKLGHLY